MAGGVVVKVDQGRTGGQSLKSLIKTLLGAIVVPTIAVVPFALGQHSWIAFALMVILGGASAVVGALLGFLFGVPRVLSSDNPNALADETEGQRATIVANTNLEQISDWLTKVLVGVGLTQFTTISTDAAQLFKSVGKAVGAPNDAGTIFVGGLAVYCFSCGFAMGWLFTRLLLGRAMAQAG